MQNRVFGDLGYEGPKSLCICSVWSEPLLSVNIIIGCYRIFQWKEMPIWDFAHVEDDLNSHILLMLKGTLSLDPAHTCITMEHWGILYTGDELDWLQSLVTK